MGQVFTALTVTNSADIDNAESGLMSADRVRSLEIEDVLVDTGATHLCLPLDVIQGLGLRALRKVTVETATGPVVTRLYRNAQVEVLGRETIGICIELPVGSRALLGAIPMESLGVEPDLQNRTLRLLPESDPRSYIYA